MAKNKDKRREKKKPKKVKLQTVNIVEHYMQKIVNEWARYKDSKFLGLLKKPKV